MFDAAKKRLTLNTVAPWRQSLRENGRALVVTNGCFDLLHAGHVSYLERARNLGEALLIGLNGDGSVRELKGEGRPINGEDDRALVLSGLGCVDGVCVFPEMRADRFLDLVQPDIYVKGGDYTVETLDKNERAAVERHGGRIEILSFVAGKSTTATLEKMQKTGE